MKATPAFVTVCVLLGCSALLNVALLTRPREAEPQARASAPVRAEPRPAGREEPAYSPVSETPRPLESPRRTQAPSEPAAKLASLPRGPSVKDDPAVAAVIEAQGAFKAFWNDLDQLFKAKQRLDDQKVFQTALATTMDFLELPEAGRSTFVEAARGGVTALALARAEEDEARRSLPPRDKANPASAAAYDQQRKAIDQRYKERVKSAVDGLKSRLDPQNPRHVEFGASAEKWLRNLVPRQP